MEYRLNREQLRKARRMLRQIQAKKQMWMDELKSAQEIKPGNKYYQANKERIKVAEKQIKALEFKELEFEITIKSGVIPI
jgi:DNA repair exonuclease SbcCD ATPase subunit